MKDDQRTRASSGNGDAMESAARRPSLEETEDDTPTLPVIDDVPEHGSQHFVGWEALRNLQGGHAFGSGPGNGRTRQG